MHTRTETVIVGGGQAGLSTSYYLTQMGRPHVVLEQAAAVASAWRNGRWDSFTLVTPNWIMQLPGAEYDGPDREGFMPRDEVIAYFERYVEQFNLPVRCNTRVITIQPHGERGYRVDTNQGVFEATNVVVATGFEQLPRIPDFAASISPDVTQLHSSEYRNPESLPAGAVLVVGSAQSGTQITEELYRRGRKVFLATGSAGRAPRRYRGKDIIEWLLLSGFFNLTPEQFPFPLDSFVAPHVSGVDGGHTLNLHQFARDGVTLLGHLRGADGDTLHFAPDLYENLARADGFEQEVAQMLDGFIRGNGIDAPDETLPVLRDGFDQPIIEMLDVRTAGITAIIWATGYRYDYSLVKLPILNEEGLPIQIAGVTDYPGLYFIGLPFMPTLKTGMLAGVGEAARSIALAVATTPNVARSSAAVETTSG